MDASNADRLLRHGTKYRDLKAVPRPLHYLDMTNYGVIPSSIDPSQQELHATLQSSALQPNSARVLFVDQERLYLDNSTLASVNLSQSEWLDVLDTCRIPPPALELLYDNNGGSFQHVSYCNDNPQTPCDAAGTGSGPCAYHTCFKLCVWHYEHFVYARYDFHTQTVFIMVAGTANEAQLAKLVTQFHGQRDIGLFDILLALAHFWALEVEEMRWLANHMTRKYESQTGFSGFNHNGIAPLPPEKLRLRAGMASTQENLRVIGRASDHVGEFFGFLQDSLRRFEAASSEQHTGMSGRNHQPLFDALDMRISQQRSQATQIRNLKARMTAQWDIINAILSHYNNNLTVDMARDSRTDSVLMRRIAFVTMIFLPATFLATFFSMVFFEVADGGASFSVSRWIWVYFVCTMPFTVLLAWQYTGSDWLTQRVLGLSKEGKQE